MKKYKLIKEYPNSPKLGYIITSPHYYLTESKTTYHWLPGIKLENGDYKEYWEEVIEKEYEILSFKSPYGSEPVQYHSCFLNNKKYSILSIKRLFDEEVFTVGDIVDYGSNKFIIERFEIYENHIKIWFETGCYAWLFNDQTHIVKKPKISLFITEDGINIFEGDSYYIIDNTIAFYKLLRGTIQFVAKNNTTCNPSYKYFSTKEKAEEYILMNKPCLSINEFKSLGYVSRNNPIVDKLKQMVKEKL